MRAMRKAVFSSRLWHYTTRMPFLRCALAAGGRAQTGWSAEGFETDASLFRHLNERLQISPRTLHKHLAWLAQCCAVSIYHTITKKKDWVLACFLADDIG